jgi:hypothetical protein
MTKKIVKELFIYKRRLNRSFVISDNPSKIIVDKIQKKLCDRIKINN